MAGLAVLHHLIFFSVFLEAFSPVYVSAADGYTSEVGASRYGAGKSYLIDRNRYFLSRFDVQELSISQKPDGSWADINYLGQSPASWEPIQHLDRLAALAVAYAEEKKSGRPIEMLGDVLVRGVRFWIKSELRSKNWWFNDIGVPRRLIVILAACEKCLSISELSEIRTRFLPNMDMVPPERLKGQNSVWYSEVFYGIALVFKDESLLVRARKLFEGELTVGEKEGVQPDYSFHQHGKQFYSGGYGFDFLIDSIDLAYGYRLVGLAISDKKTDFLVNYALMGIYPLIRSGWIDWSARGREVGRLGSNASKVGALVGALKRLEELSQDPIHKSKVLDFLGSLTARQFNKAWVGSKYYWSSDFLVHQTDKLYGSVRVTDGGHVAAEGLNGENSSGYWASFGATYLQTKGDEYIDASPFFDWSRMPGVTSLGYLPKLEGYLEVPDSRAVGFANGDAGFIGFRFSHLNLSASRSWFFFKNSFVMLGAGIASSSANNVITTIAQVYCREVRAAECVPRLEEEGRNKKRVYIGGLVYTIDSDDPILFSRKSVPSSEKKEDLVVETVVSAWIDHGLRPSESAFIVRARLLDDESAIPDVIANDPVVQAISFDGGRVICAVFHAGGELLIARDLVIRVNQLSAVTLTETDKDSVLVLSAPIADAPASLDVIKNGVKMISRKIAVGENNYSTTGVSLKISFPKY